MSIHTRRYIHVHKASSRHIAQRWARLEPSPAKYNASRRKCEDSQDFNVDAESGAGMWTFDEYVHVITVLLEGTKPALCFFDLIGVGAAVPLELQDFEQYGGLDEVSGDHGFGLEPRIITSLWPSPASMNCLPVSAA